MKATIYHNPNCGTSRKTLEILREEGADVTIVEYLKDTPSKDELKRLYDRAGITPRQGLRAKERLAQDLERREERKHERVAAGPDGKPAVNPSTSHGSSTALNPAPQLPSGYATMIVLACVTPLWRRVMDPKVVTLFDGDISQANLHPRTAQRYLSKYPVPEAREVAA